MTAEFLSGSRDTLPKTTLSGIVILQDILTDILFGKKHIRSGEKVFQQGVRIRTKHMLPILPSDDIIFAKPAGHRHFLFGRHQGDNRFIEPEDVILQHPAQGDLFG